MTADPTPAPAPAAVNPAAQPDPLRRFAVAILLNVAGLGGASAPLFMAGHSISPWFGPMVWIIATGTGWHLCETSIKWRIHRAVTKLRARIAEAQFAAIIQGAQRQQQEAAAIAAATPTVPPAADPRPYPARVKKILDKRRHNDG